MNNLEIRTRFAPSPTGYMHLGGLRTALYAFLFAKKNDGKFILRIEDTDAERFVEGATELIYKTLKSAGLFYDEGPDVGGDFGPYIQSERKEIYKKYIDEIVERGHAYHCF
ncbi:MAG: glutamate--tRNA ligase, partial [Clostridiales bacterium]|nr:glutamate--tRNA ligase [Clostridiales bacterium]